jgi:hypothetical protein
MILSKDILAAGGALSTLVGIFGGVLLANYEAQSVTASTMASFGLAIAALLTVAGVVLIIVGAAISTEIKPTPTDGITGYEGRNIPI